MQHIYKNILTCRNRQRDRYLHLAGIADFPSVRMHLLLSRVKKYFQIGKIWNRTFNCTDQNKTCNYANFFIQQSDNTVYR